MLKKAFTCLLLALWIAVLLPVPSVPRAGAAGGSGGGLSLLHDSLNDLYRTPGGAVPVNTPVTLRFRATAGAVDTVTVRLWNAFTEKQQMLPMEIVTTTPEGYDFWEVSFNVGKNPTIYWYRFIVTRGTTVTFYEDDTRPGGGAYFPANESGPGTSYDQSPDLSWQITVYDPAYYTPEWMRNAVIYQIFPDRFRNGDPTNDPADGSITFYDGQPVIFHETWNEPPIDPRQPGEYQDKWNLDFFGGDLAGITEKLDYLQALGVTAIYLNPIFAANSNHRYDTADFKAIDPILGDLAAFQALVAAAKQRGMVVILDGVFNHTSSDSVYFDRYHRYDTDGACESLDSVYRNWFLFVPPKGQQPSACVDTPTGATFYDTWSGLDTLPKINSARPEPRLFFYTGRNSVVNTWGREGIGGWRLDVGGDIDAGPASDYWEGFRVAVRNANPEGVIIGEEWGNASKWLLGKEWDSVMNYRLRRGILGFALAQDYTDDDSKDDTTIHALTPAQIDGLIRDIESDTPPVAYYAMMNILGSHDVSRLTYVLGNDPQRQKLAALLQFTLPGAPTIYYGDEIALDAPSQPDGSGIIKDDPYNRAPYPWPDASGDTYSRDEDMLAFYQQLGALRQANPALREGEMITLLADDEKGVYAFLRRDQASGSAAVVVLNNSDQMQIPTLDFSGLLPLNLTLEPVFGGKPFFTTLGAAAVTLGPLSGNVWTVTAETGFTAPAPPTNLFTLDGNGGASVFWDAVEGAAGYVVYRSPVAVGGFEPIATRAVYNLYNDFTITNGYKYYYAVASIGADGVVGKMSGSVMAIPSAPIAGSFYVLDTLPPQITYGYGVTVQVTAGVIIQGKTGKDQPVKGVRAEAALVPPGTDDVPAWIPMQHAGAQDGADLYTAALDVYPRAGEGWTIRVRFSSNAGKWWTLATTPEGGFPALTILAPEDQDAPAPPASVSIAQASINGVTVAWEPSPSADVAAYEIHRFSGDDAIHLAYVAAGSEPRFEDRAVVQGSTYRYSVSAIDGAYNYSEPVQTDAVKVQRNAVPVTFTVTVPDYTKEGEGGLYIAGDFGTDALPFWDPAGIAMTQIDDRHWTVTLDIPEGTKAQYKYVRGAWTAVEKGPECEEIANRVAEVTPGMVALAVDDVIAKWRDLDKCP